ncbi:MAG: DUF5320 domain-containing protein [Pseudomonadota bacterium]
MPGFDGSGPTGMGSMTGGARGWCNPYGRHFARSGFGPLFGWGRGRGRGYRHMYWATAMPRWMRSQPGYSWSPPFADPPTRGQEMEFLNDQAVALKGELEAIQGRLRDIEKEAEKVN